MYYTTSAAKVKVFFVYSVGMAHVSQIDLLLSGKGQAEMCISLLRHAAAAGRPGQEAALQQIRLVHVFQRDRFFAQCRSQRR